MPGQLEGGQEQLPGGQDGAQPHQQGRGAVQVHPVVPGARGGRDEDLHVAQWRRLLQWSLLQQRGPGSGAQSR